MNENSIKFIYGKSPQNIVKVSNYLSTLVQKRTAYQGTHVGAFNLEFLSQIKQVFSSQENLWLLNLGRKPLHKIELFLE